MLGRHASYCYIVPCVSSHVSLSDHGLTVPSWRGLDVGPASNDDDEAEIQVGCCGEARRPPRCEAATFAPKSWPVGFRNQSEQFLSDREARYTLVVPLETAR